VQGEAPFDDRTRKVQVRHARVHLLVHEPEGEGLVADKGLRSDFMNQIRP
jgi:hypothetical protein